MIKTYFIIENTYNEMGSCISRICDTFEEALIELKDCHDWYCNLGTGMIYEVDSHMNRLHKWTSIPYRGIKQDW